MEPIALRAFRFPHHVNSLTWTPKLHALAPFGSTLLAVPLLGARRSITYDCVSPLEGLSWFSRLKALLLPYGPAVLAKTRRPFKRYNPQEPHGAVTPWPATDGPSKVS